MFSGHSQILSEKIQHRFFTTALSGSGLGIRVTLANCRQSLNMAWPQLALTWGILEKGRQMGVATHQPWSRISAAFCSAYSTQLLACVSTCIHRYGGRYSRSSCLFWCHCQQNCCPLYNRCAHSDCPSSSFKLIGGIYLRLNWLPSCMTTLLTVALNYSIQKHTDWRIYIICQGRRHRGGRGSHGRPTF